MINDVVSVPVMGLIMFTAVNPRIMGKFIIPVRHCIARWAAKIAMGAATLAMFWLMFAP
ncbi:hypothetical protein ACQKRQ_27390 [Paraburkholderia sp. NPDC080076]|uniref:hypothetical protein n=1 Tax=Paraburkholderia sp. NPDC080076 TaxID=3390605 RepID=UPI003CFFEB04